MIVNCCECGETETLFSLKRSYIQKEGGCEFVELLHHEKCGEVLAPILAKIRIDRMIKPVEKRRPSFELKIVPKLDGNKWCALYGENLQEGIAGFGDSPDESMLNFDKEWFAKRSEK